MICASVEGKDSVKTSRVRIGFFEIEKIRFRPRVCPES